MQTSLPLRISKNSPYPLPLPAEFGALAEFFNHGVNTLLIVIPGITSAEEYIISNGRLEGGLLSQDDSILLFWIFSHPDYPGQVLRFETPFDARRIRDLTLPVISDSNSRLPIAIHAVDSATKIVRSLRIITMPNEMSIAFLSAVQDQIASSLTSEVQLKLWLSMPLGEATQASKTWVLGE